MFFNRCRQTLLVTISLCSFAATGFAEDYALEKAETVPAGLASDVAAALAPNGYRIVSGKKAVCEIWLCKDIPVKSDFQPTLSLKYPLTSGELIGVLQVPKRSKFSDFREQPIEDGLYTLRYGKQPQDGNHIGTSEYSDFLLALPAKEDESTSEVDDVDKLQTASAEATGGAHPAIFQLLPLEETTEPATLVHLEDHDFWVLQLKKGTGIPIDLRLIVIGHAEE